MMFSYFQKFVKYAKIGRFPFKKNSDDVTTRKGKNEKMSENISLKKNEVLFSIIPNFTHTGLASA
jgi:hypothetical protein